MRLGWNEIAARAAAFADEWRDARYEKGETQSFYNEFFEVFGVRRRQVASFEEPVKKLGDRQGFIDLFWKGVLLVEQKSAGRDLVRAKEQALDYFPGLKPEELPRYILLSDFQTFELYDLEAEEEADRVLAFDLADLPHHVQKFGFVLGVERRAFRDQDPVNIAVAETMGELHDALEASGYRGHDLERFLVRLLFCLFADNTGIFEPRDIFLDLLERRSTEDGRDLGALIGQLFEVLDTPPGEHQSTLDPDLAQFPYVNGSLFSGHLRTPAFNAKMRGLLVEACTYDWGKVSPAIFGSLFQSVMDSTERRKKGAHYTTETNILKVIGPLCLDELTTEFERIAARRTGRTAALRAFQGKLASLNFLDPACGCGNFLVIAYRELRALEMRVLHALNDTGQLELDVELLSKVNVDQFYGIELEEFPARIAETAMWMMDHIMNVALSLAFGRAYARIPLKAAPTIRGEADALAVDWNDVLPHEECFAVLGNPPFVGAKFQTSAQREQVRAIARLGGSGGTLDYVAAWFIKAGEYVARGPTRIGFVATNSITQGEQVAQLWPILFDRHGLEIAFAHRTFAWGSDARGKAHVHVVIVGLSHRDREPAEKRLFSYDDINGDPEESRHAALTAYLFGADEVKDRHLVVSEESRPINGARALASGSQPIDDGHLIFKAEEHTDFLEQEPAAEPFLRRYVGAADFINGGERWILSLQSASPTELRAMPKVLERLQAVRAFRSASKRKGTRAIAHTPQRFNVEVLPTSSFLAVPEVSSERRDYIPLGWLNPPTIPSNKLRLLPDASLWEFGVLTSRMHMAWTAHIGGRLKSDYQYGIGLNYNTFPWPDVTPAERTKVEALAQGVLDARAAWPDATLADLYDPDAMPADLRRAHRALDQAVDRLYRREPFAGDRDRVEHLFGRYEALVDPLEREGTKQNKRVSRNAKRRAAR